MSWIGTREALALLGTKPQTLYANVSRGRIAAKPDPTDPRKSLYRREDVEALAGKNRGRRAAEVVAAQTIAFGEPVLETAISTIAKGRLVYRGMDAAALAETAGLEETAQLLWQAPGVAGFDGATRADGERGLVVAYRQIAELAATQMPPAGRARSVLIKDGALVVALMAASLAGNADGPVHQRLAQQWQRPEAAEAIRVALVLLAEHELNASTFAARVAASTGAPLAAAVLAGLATLSGPLHGTASLAMGQLVREAQRHGVDEAVGAVLRQGRPLPCFGHRLYADGDVRAPAILARVAVPAIFAEIAAVGERLTGEKPNVDFALAALTAAFDLPGDAPLQLFALARSVGWIAHALEQGETGALIRPRARYVGQSTPHPSLPAADPPSPARGEGR